MIIDAIVLAVLLISALIAFFRGFIRETLTILGVAGGLGAAYFGGPALSPFFKGWLGVKEGEPAKRLFDVIPYPILADILSYGLIFIAVVIVLSLVSHVLSTSARAVGLGAVDRTLGVIFGLARGALLLAIIYMPFQIGMDEESKKTWMEGSGSAPYLDAASAQLVALIPESTIDTWKKKAEENSEVKDRLEQIDVLKGDQPPEDAQGGNKTDSNAPGYSEEFRKKMDKMFEEDAPPQPGPAGHE